MLTLVDTATAELQSLAEPKIKHELSSRLSVNSSLLSNDVGQSEHEQETLPTPQIPTIDETIEQSNDTDLTDHEKVLLLKNISEEAPEVVVIVRAEQKVNTNILEPKVEEEEEEAGQAVSEELPKADETFTATIELNDTAVKEQLISGSRDETAAVILDGLVTSGPTDSHEDIPSFSEWAQKRLEEAEKKKSEFHVALIITFTIEILIEKIIQAYIICN